MNVQDTFRKWQSLQPLTREQEYLLSKKFTIEYNYNSNHIEGNTLTYGQTELLLLFGITSKEGHVKDFADMKASQVGMEMVSEAVHDRSMPLTQNFIRQLHKIILREDYVEYRNLPGGKTICYTIHAGQYKSRPNSVITRYGDRFEYASPEETPALMTELVDWYNAAEREGKLSPVELAALFHYRYIRIHPFEDGNGRIARLMVNYILARHGWPMVVVRSRCKEEYLEALHKSDMNVGLEPARGANATILQIRHFLKYFTRMVDEEIKYNIGIVEKYGEDVWWFDGQELKFRSPNNGKMMRLMKANPCITYRQMSEALGINSSAMQKLLEGLRKKGYIERRDDSWYVYAITTKKD